MSPQMPVETGQLTSSKQPPSPATGRPHLLVPGAWPGESAKRQHAPRSSS